MKDAKPDTEGAYLVFAESASPDKPFIKTAWWNSEAQQWENIPKVWAEGVSHWQTLPKRPRATRHVVIMTLLLAIALTVATLAILRGARLALAIVCVGMLASVYLWRARRRL